MNARARPLLGFALLALHAASAYADDGPEAAPATPNNADYVAVPPATIEQEKLEGFKPALPTAARKRAVDTKQAELAVSDMIFIDKEGRVVHVEPVLGSGDSELDETVAAALRTWRFKPQQRPIRSVVRMVYNTKYRNVPPAELQALGISTPFPELPHELHHLLVSAGPRTAMYKYCVLDGHVTQVLPLQGLGDPGDHWVVEAMNKWTFRRQPEGMCALTRFVFEPK